MSFTNNARDEVTLIFLKHKYLWNELIQVNKSISFDIRKFAEAENFAIRKTFEEVRKNNAQNLQAGSYEAVAEQCDEFFKSIAAEPAQVG